MRIVITGMGGELGTRVASLLEDRDDVDAILGLDGYPPRRWLRRAEFVRIDPRDQSATRDTIESFGVTALVHLGIYEPDARADPEGARARTQAGLAAVRAAGRSASLDRVVVRSGIEVYGRGPGVSREPDESAPTRPTSPFGRSLLGVETEANRLAEQADVPVTALRFAPVVGPHFPSPLGRCLRLPLVPVNGLSSPRFSLLHQEDAAEAVVAALDVRHHGPLNVVADGDMTPLRALRMGNRVPLPFVGPAWLFARALARVVGAPVPAHVVELLQRGRLADGRRARSVLPPEPQHTTTEIVKALYRWAQVIELEPRRLAA